MDPFLMSQVTRKLGHQYLCVLILLSISAALTACGGGGSGTHPQASLVSIAVTPPSASVAAGLTQQFTATGSFSDGTTQLLSSANWSTSDPAVAMVSSSGLVSTLKQGSVTISASSASVSGNAALAIGPPQQVGISISSTSVFLDSTAKLSAFLN